MSHMKVIVHDHVIALQNYAKDNYAQGGHWVYECYDVADYMHVLERYRHNLTRAKAHIKRAWEMLVERERECAFDAEND